MTRPSRLISPFGERHSCFRVGCGIAASAFARMGFSSALGGGWDLLVPAVRFRWGPVGRPSRG